MNAPTPTQAKADKAAVIRAMKSAITGMINLEDDFLDSFRDADAERVAAIKADLLAISWRIHRIGI